MKYLKVKNDVYIYNRHIPKQFKEAFNATAINRSLKTDSYKEAIKARDQMNVWFDKKCRAEASNPLFFEKLKEYEGLTKEQANDELDRWSHETGDHYPHIDHPEWDGVSDPLPEEDELEYMAIQKVLGSDVNVPDKYRLTVNDCLIKVLDEKKDLPRKTLNKYKRATEMFHKFIGREQQYVYAISRGIGRNFISEMKKTSADQTIKGWLSVLSTLWRYARDIENLNNHNPFTEWTDLFKKTTKRKKKFYKNWNIDNLKKVIECCKTEQDKLLIYIGWYTGARLDEIVTITYKDIIQDKDSNIRYFSIKEDSGKNEYAERHTPIHKELELLLKEFNAFDERPSSDAFGKSFKRAKIKAGFSELGKKYSFHSLRGNCSTNLENMECPEHIANQITGHAPSDTMTYGYYSGGVSLELKNKYIQQLPTL